MSTKVNLISIAKECNVSHVTVSRILNGKANLHSSKTVERVEAAAKAQGYRPNLAAQNMKGKSTKTVGVIMPFGAGDWFSNASMALQQELIKSRYLPICLGLSDQSADNLTHLDHLLDRRVDGIIFWPDSDDNNTEALLKQLSSESIPVVLMDKEYIAPNHLDFVGSDDYEGGKKVANFLISLGHSSVLILGIKGLRTTEKRKTGFIERFQGSSGNEISEIDIDIGSGINNENIEGQIADILIRKDTPRTIFCLTDRIAVIANKMAWKLNIPMPDKLSLMSYGGNNSSYYVHPSITTINQQPRGMGKNAARLLIERMDGIYTNDTARNILIEPVLKIRDSVAQKS